MATSLVSLSLVTPNLLPHLHLPSSSKPLASFPPSASSGIRQDTAALRGLRLRRRKKERRGDVVVVVRAGPTSLIPPSTTSLILAFVLPLSLILGTVFASIRIADKLDERYLEELAMNKAIMEENEVFGGEEEEAAGAAAVGADREQDGAILVEEEATAAPRVRNRPRRREV